MTTSKNKKVVLGKSRLHSIISIFLVSLVFSVSPISLSVAKADIWSGTDWANLTENTTSAVNSTTQTGTQLAEFSWTAVGKNLLDTAAYMAAQNLLNQLTQNTITWIRGGFHGSPSFAVDTETMAIEIADSVVGGLVLSLRNLASCEFTATYKDDLVNTLDLSVKKRPYTFNQRASCPFIENYNFKASDFYDDFRRGGWKMMELALNDGGNPYGVQYIVGQEQSYRERQAQSTSDKKLSWANGFKDVPDITQCNYPSSLFAYAGDPSGRYDEAGGAILLTEEEAKQRNEETFSDPQFAASLRESYCKTATPGKMVSDQLSKTLGVDMDKIGFSDNMNKIVAAFIDTMVQKTIRSVFGTSKSIGGNPGSQVTPVMSVSTSPATNIGRTSAVLNGYLTYAGSETGARAWFEVRPAGETASELIPAVLKVTNFGQGFSIIVNGLTPDTSYVVNTIVTTHGRSPGASPSSDLRGTDVIFTTDKP